MNFLNSMETRDRGISGVNIIAIMTQIAAEQPKEVIRDLLGRLDEAIDDMEQGRVQTIEESWVEIDAI